MNFKRNVLAMAVMQGYMQAADSAGAVGSGAAAVNTNPLSHDIKAQVVKNLVAMTDVKFNFRSVAVTDDKGLPIKEADGKTDKKWKRPTYTRALPLLTTAGLMAALQAGDKTTELILDAANQAIIDRARGLINDKIDSEPKAPLEVNSIDDNALQLFAIANLPKSERGAGISKDEWAAFAADYKAVMATDEAVKLFPDAKPRSPDVLEKHAVLLTGKFNQVRSRKDVVQNMLTFLDVWVQISPNAEEHQDCYEFLKNKGNTIMQGESFDDL